MPPMCVWAEGGLLLAHFLHHFYPTAGLFPVLSDVIKARAHLVPYLKNAKKCQKVGQMWPTFGVLLAHPSAGNTRIY